MKNDMQTLLATSICQKLFEEGYIAYFAGGWVRDRLLGKSADEIDIATSAPPSIVEKLFSKTIPVGIAFGVVIVVLEGINFEVTTFRKDHSYDDGRHPNGVDFSTPEKDALRRDFTINGLFYDPLADTIYDFVEGESDLQKGIIRAIGDPTCRFNEDRLRMVRAVRFSSRLGFTIEKQTKEAIKKQADSLFPSVSIERIWQELSKMASYPHFDRALLQLQELGLLKTIFPDLKQTNITPSVKYFPYFPPNCPTILFIIQLFPHASLEDLLIIGDYLKIPNRDKKLVCFFKQSEPLFSEKTQEKVTWAHFYAHPLSTLVLQVKTAQILPPNKQSFIEQHEKRKLRLKNAIERISEKRPLVTAQMLADKGVKQGKQMGILLKEAERLSINLHLEDPQSVISILHNRLYFTLESE